jgi:hypothetical protein
LLEKQGNRLKYIDVNGEEHLDYRKQWIGDKLDMIMNQYEEKLAPVLNSDTVDADLIDENEESFE